MMTENSILSNLRLINSNAKMMRDGGSVLAITITLKKSYNKNTLMRLGRLLTKREIDFEAKPEGMKIWFKYCVIRIFQTIKK